MALYGTKAQYDQYIALRRAGKTVAQARKATGVSKSASDAFEANYDENGNPVRQQQQTAPIKTVDLGALNTTGPGGEGGTSGVTPGLDMNVRAIQQGLVDAGYKIAVDGIWGPKTQAAYNDYQARGGKGPGAAGGAPTSAPARPRSTGTTTAGTAPVSPPPAGPSGASNIDVKSAYGAYGWLADIPEINDLLNQAVAGNWTPDKLTAAIQNSAWYKTHTQHQIDFEILRREHPQEAEKQVHDMAQQLIDQATQIGFSLSMDRAHAIAEHSISFDLNSDEVNKALLAEFHYSPSSGGKAGATTADLKQRAAAQHVPLSDDAIGQWVTGILNGTTTEDSFDAYLREQAKSLYPSLAAAIDSGITVDTYADPYRQLAAQELGINPNSIDFTDPKWNAALVQTDPKTGQRVSMSLDEWRTQLRSDPRYGWGNTVGAKSMMAGVATDLARGLGQVA